MIRAATENDVDEILAIWNPEIRETLITFNSVEKSKADLVQILSEKHAAGQPFLVFETDGEIAGFATYGQFRSGVGYRYTAEHTIVLSQIARGKGIGRALMTAIEDHARAAGLHSMLAGVSGGNRAGVDFHARLGYAEIATLPQVGHKFDRWLDLVLMQKLL